MTEQEIIDMAFKAGIKYRGFGDEFYSPHSDGVGIEDMEAFVKLVEQRKCKELADKIAAMPFGDTAASFAVWVREQA